jgi:hypothetical protein
VFLTLRWMMLVKVLKVGVLRRWLYMAVKPLQVGLMQMDYLAPPAPS